MGLYVSVDAPEPRDLGEEAEQIAEVNTRYAPKQYELESTYRPKYAELDRQIAFDNLFAEGNGVLDMGLAATGKIAEQNRAANTAQRTADIEDVTNLSGSVNELQREANPELYSLLDTLDAKATAPGSPSMAEARLAQSLGIPASVPPTTAAQLFGPRQPGEVTAANSPATPARTMGPVSAPSSPAGAMGPEYRKPPSGGVPGVADPTAPDDVATIGQSGVLAALSNQATADLQRGGALDPTTQREIEQATLARYNSTGRAGSNRATAAIAAEMAKTAEGRKQAAYERAMGTEELLQNLARANAGIQQGNQATGLNMAELKQRGDITNGQFQIAGRGLNLQEQDQQLREQEQQLREQESYRQGLMQLIGTERSREADEFGRVQTAVGNRAATVFDPFAGVLARPSINQTSYAQAANNPAGNQNPSGSYNVFNGYGSNLFSQNFAQANENARTDAAFDADFIGGLMSGAGAIAGAGGFGG